MNPDLRHNHKPFFKLLGIAFAVGFLVGLALCIVWRSRPEAFTAQTRFASIVICPPFLLAGVIEATSDAPLALIVTLPSIVLANGFLYAGLASFAYFLATVFLRKRPF